VTRATWPLTQTKFEWQAAPAVAVKGKAELLEGFCPLRVAV
jgi:hypothetical protein